MVDEQLKTLAAAVRISKTTHNFVIPMLYKKIRYTENNKDKFMYGLTSSDIEEYGKHDPYIQY
jgi:hypothetical protein